MLLSYLNIFVTAHFLFLSILLFIKKTGDKKFNHLMGWMMLVIFHVNMVLVLMDFKWLDKLPFMTDTSYATYLMFGPLFLSYVRMITSQFQYSKRKMLLHFLPAIIAFIYFSKFYFYSVSEQQAHIASLHALNYTEEYQVWDAIIFLQINIYFVIGLIEVYRYEKRIKSLASNMERADVTWLKYFIWILLLVTLLVIFLNSFMTPQDLVLLAPLISSSIYLSLIYRSFNHLPIRHQEIMPRENNVNGLIEKSVIQEITDQEHFEIAEKLRAYCRLEKPYLDNDITLKSLAERMNMSAHQLSLVINKVEKKNFFDFINHQRIEEAKHKIASSDLKLEGIALDCGFNNKVTFNKAFKKYTGKTPSEYKRNVGSQVVA